MEKKMVCSSIVINPCLGCISITCANCACYDAADEERDYIKALKLPPHRIKREKKVS